VSDSVTVESEEGFTRFVPPRNSDPHVAGEVGPERGGVGRTGSRLIAQVSREGDRPGAN